MSPYWKQKLSQLYTLFFSLEGSLFRYSLAYSLLLALLPMLIALILLFQHSILFNLNSFIAYLYRFIPEELLSGFVDYITNKNFPNGLGLMIPLGMTFLLASRSIYSFMLVSAKYEHYKSPKLFIRIKAFIVFIGLLISLFGLSLFFAFVPIATHLKAFSALLSLFVILFMFYRIITFEKRPFHYGSIGALFATFAIGITGFIFLALVQDFSSYASVYGPMASLVITLLSLYIIASIIYFGYCLNFVFSVNNHPIYKHQILLATLNEWTQKIKK